jgi:hypothetical protein
MSHRKFHSPANRFYEMVSAGLPIIFQIESITMLKRAGIDVSPWACLTQEHMKKLFDRREEMGAAQQKEFRRIDHREKMHVALLGAIDKLKRAHTHR